MPSTDDEEPKTPPKNKKNSHKVKREKRVQSFREAWLSMAEFKYWLAPVSGDPRKAKVCLRDYTADISVLKSHAKTDAHLEKVSAASNPKMKMTDFLQKENVNNKLDEAVKNAEIKLVGFFGEHDAAFRGLDHLSDLVKECFPDSRIAQNIAVKRTKGTAIMKNVLGETEKCVLTEKLKKTKFSLLTDESTDIASTKTSCILVRYYDEERGSIVSNFWDLVQVLKPGGVTSATAEHLYQNICHSLEERGIPKENLVVGFGSDGCNVMMGGKNSVATRLLSDFPYITILKCICH